MSEATTVADPDATRADRTGGLWAYLRGGAKESSAESTRWAAIVFAAVVVAAVPLILYQGRDQWFFLDEWVFITQQDLGADYLLRPHNEHLVLIPRLVYGGLYQVAGLGAYWPYQIVVVGAHLVAAVLLRVVMRRCDVRPWIATAVASAFVVFGSGRQDIVWAFQIAFTGALAFGLAQLLLSDHDGPIRWRDAGGLACGLGAILCSSVGVIMVGVVGLSLALRRRWMAAAFHVVPLAVIWSAWWLTKGRDAYESPAGPRGAYDYATDGLANAFDRLGQVSGIGLLIGIVLVAGVVLAVRSEGVAPFVRRAALPLALVLGGWAFLAVTGFARAGRTGNDVPQATRYVYLTMAMLVPVLAVAIDQLADRARGAAIAALVALAIGVPGNVDALRPQSIEVFTLGREDVVLVGAHLPEMEQLPANLSPFSWFEAPVTAGWLRGAVADGRVPNRDVSPVTKANIAMEVTLDVRPGSPQPGACPLLEEPVDLTLEQGQTIAFAGGDLEARLRYDDALSDPATFPATGSQNVVASAGPLELTVRPKGGVDVEVCLPGDEPAAAQGGADWGEIEEGFEGTGPKVAVLGDLLTVDSREELGARLGDYALRVGAIKSEGISGGPRSEALGGGDMREIASRFAEDDPEVVVIALGMNEAARAELTADAAEGALEEIVDSFDGACIVTVTVSEQGTRDGYDIAEAQRVNELLRAAGDEVVPWSERSSGDPERYLTGDGVKQTDAGRELFAELIGEAVDSCSS